MDAYYKPIPFNKNGKYGITYGYTMKYIIIIFLMLQYPIDAQELPRSVSFGTVIRDINDSINIQYKLLSNQGTLILKVINGSSAHLGGLHNEDVLVSLNGEEIENTRYFLDLLKKYRAGDKVNVGYIRKSVLHYTLIVLQPKVKQISDRYDIIYSSVKSGENHLRTIITKPKTSGKHPAVLLIGGVGCYSTENTSSKYLRSTGIWVDSLTRNGFVTMRVEKTGMGDSEGIPCDSCDFVTEKNGYLDALYQLKYLPYVNEEQVFIAGFSIGGVIAPIISKEISVKGIAVYGTVGRNWFEYELENSHRQRLLEGYSPDSIDLFMRAEYKRLYGLFVEKKSPGEIEKEHPETSSVLFNYPMHIKYFQQVADINIRGLWKNTNVYVCAMHGSSDFVSSSEEHELIVSIVNRNNPDMAEYTKIDNSDHWELYAESKKVSKSHSSSEVNPQAAITAMKWMKSIMNKK